MAISFGKGLALRTKPGGPGWGEVKSYFDPTMDKVQVLGVNVKGKWKDTPHMLSHIKDYPNFEMLWDDLLRNPTLKKFLSIAYVFSRELGMYPEELVYVNKLRGVLGSYAKKSVFLVVVKNEYINDIIKILKKEGYEPVQFVISGGIRLYQKLI